MARNKTELPQVGRSFASAIRYSIPKLPEIYTTFQELLLVMLLAALLFQFFTLSAVIVLDFHCLKCINIPDVSAMDHLYIYIVH